MTINTYIETIVENNPNQIITVYDKKHNIAYHGKADFAPLSLWDEYQNSYVNECIDIHGHPVTNLVINDIVDKSREDTTKEADTVKEYTNKGLKKLAKAALLMHYGFAPALSNIVLMEANTNGEYIGIDVDGHGYQIYGKIWYLSDGHSMGYDPSTISINKIKW